MAKSQFRKRFKTLTGVSTLAICALAANSQAVAQDDEIIVTGIRSSLADALNTKKNAPQILDGISAEDIGKFPDTNVAESLARVTGVQIDRSAGAAGEGSFITIRGLGPDTNRTFVNGRAVLSTGFAERSVDFRDLPSESVSALTVIKSPRASDIDGSLGGFVNVVTRRPLDDGGEFRAVISGQGVYSNLLDEVDPRISGLISNSWADGTFGVLVGAIYQQRDTRQDSFSTNGFRCRTADLSSGSACDAAGAVFVPRNLRYQLRYNESERFGIYGSAQFRPSDRLEIIADGSWHRRDESLNDVIYDAVISPGSIDLGSLVVGSQGTALAFTHTGPSNFNLFANQTPNREATVFNGGVNLAYDVSENLSANLDIGYSTSKSDTDGFDFPFLRAQFGDFLVDFRTDSGLPDAPVLGGYEAAPLDATPFNVVMARNSSGLVDQEDLQIKGDLSYRFSDDSVLESLDVGMRYSDSEFFAGVIGARARSNFFRFFGSPEPIPAGGVTTTADLFGFDDFGSGLPGGQIGNFLVPVSSVINDAYFPLSEDQFVANVPDTALIEENTLAGYAQLNFSMDRVAGNFGVRIVNTDLTSSGEIIVGREAVFNDFTGEGVLIEPVSIDSSYTDVLPSVNISVDVIPDELIFRFGASKTLYRAEPDELSARGTLDVVNGQLVTGNPTLDPFRATNFDFSAEYYFGADGLISLALFTKQIESFILTGQPTGATFTSSDGLVVDVVGPINGQGGTLRGFELGYQQSFADFLPAPFDGFGVVANYTFIDDQTDNLTFNSTGEAAGLPGVSKHSYNLIGYYENYGFSARLAYNYRGSFVQPDRRANDLLLVQDGFGQLDGRVAYAINDNIELSVEAQNILDNNISGFAENEETFAEIFNFGRRIFFGARLQF